MSRFTLRPIIKHVWAIQREFVDWSVYKAKLPAGTTLLSVTPQATPGITAVSGGLAGDVSAVVLSGGTAGQRYRVPLRCEWSNGDTDERSVTVEVKAIVPAAPAPIEIDPNADLVYGVDWAALLAKLGAGVTIAGHDWPAAQISPVGAIVIDNLSLSGSVSQARLSAAIDGKEITVEARVTFSNGDRDARSLIFRGRQT
jgi:hypothetical protein